MSTLLGLDFQKKQKKHRISKVKIQKKNPAEEHTIIRHSHSDNTPNAVYFIR